MALAHKFSNAASLTYAKTPARFLFRPACEITPENSRSIRDDLKQMCQAEDIPVEVNRATISGKSGEAPVVIGFDLTIKPGIAPEDYAEVRDQLLEKMSWRHLLPADEIEAAKADIDLENEFTPV